jgi:hypothetical protein
MMRSIIFRSTARPLCLLKHNQLVHKNCVVHLVIVFAVASSLQYCDTHELSKLQRSQHTVDILITG